MRFDFSVMVWGERYIRVYLDATIRIHIAALKQFPWMDGVIYYIFTDIDSAQLLRENEYVRALSSLVEVKFEIFDPTDHSKWGSVRRCHQRQVILADERDAATYFLSADQILSPESFVNAATHIVKGRTAVLTAGVRTNEEDILPLLAGITPASRELIRMGLAYQHRETQVWHWDDPDYFQYGTYIYFKVGGEGLLAHCYVLHPLVVYPQVKNAAPSFHIYDQDWLYAACPDIDRMYICQDFDEICQFEVSPRDMGLPSKPAQHSDSVQAMAWYVKGRYTEHHLRFVFTPIRIHYGGMSPEIWQPVEERALGIISAIDSIVRKA